MAAVPYIWFRGRRMTAAFRDAILAAEQRAGFEFTMTQGGFNAGGVLASAGTHDGDAADWSIRGLTRDEVATMIEALRWAGIFASLRTTTALWGVRAHGFQSPHVHGVPNGWGLPSAGAKAQADAYRRGRDGLRGNGPDAGGPGHTRAWANQTSPRKPVTVVAPVTEQKGILSMSKYLRHFHGKKQTFPTGKTSYMVSHTRGWWWLHGTPGLTHLAISGYATAGTNAQIFIHAEKKVNGKNVARLVGRAPLPVGTGSFSGSAQVVLDQGEAIRLVVANHSGKPVTVDNITSSITYED